MRGEIVGFIVLTLAAGVAEGRGMPDNPNDRALRARLAAAGVGPLDPGSVQPPAKVRLGQMLFFDKLLSGNRDIACATCHHPALMTGDALNLSIGTGSNGLGPDRVFNPARGFVPRNALDVFNRGAPQWSTMFWDNRVAELSPGQFRSPAGGQLPAGLDNVLAVQALFPLTGRSEMLGNAGDPGNELARHPDGDFTGIWNGVMARVLSLPAYRALFAAAYPEATAGVGIVHAANAIAAFEAAAFTKLDSPFDRYLAGDHDALAPRRQARGALVLRPGAVRGVSRREPADRPEGARAGGAAARAG